MRRGASIHARRTAHSRPEGPIEPDLLRIPVGPGAMHVARYGHGGPPVVLIHGFATSSFVWRLVAPLLADANFTAYAVDLLGHGESDRPFDADFGIAGQAEYLDRALTALRVARAAVVGLDLGGAVALRLAGVRPERVERLGLVNGGDADALPGRDIAALHRALARHALRVRQGVLGAVAVLRPLLEGSVASPDRMPDRLVARYLAPYVGKDGASHLVLLARSVREEDLEELDLSAIRAPTLVVWGEEDRWMDFRVPERLAGAIPGSTLARIPGVARLVPEEAPERLAELLLGFLREGGTS